MIQNYYKHTPVFYRKLGDALLGVSTFVTASAIVSQEPVIAFFSLFIGAIGKFLTNFFSEGDK